MDPDLIFKFHTIIENLPAGDYVLIMDGDRRELHYEALSWNDGQRIPLVTLSGDDETRLGGSPIFDPITWQIIGTYNDDQVQDALYAIDMEPPNLHGFNFGCEDLGHVLLPAYLATGCSEDRTTWHFISRDSWEVAFSRNFLIEDLAKQTVLAWNEALGLLVFGMAGNEGFDSVCTTDTGYEYTNLCWSSELFKSARTSPDGRWLDIQVQGEEGARFGVLSTACLRDASQECKMQWVDDAPVDRRGDLIRNSVWTPDSTRIIYLISECIGTRQSQGTTIWVYDLAASTSKVLAEFPGQCFGFHYVSQPLWSPDGSGLLFDLGTQGIFLLDSVTGEMQRFLSNDPPIEVVGRFTIP